MYSRLLALLSAPLLAATAVAQTGYTAAYPLQIETAAPAVQAPSAHTALPSVAEPRVAKAAPVSVRELTARIQIFLDQQNFGPGKIDGSPGEFTSKAFARYQKAHGITPTGNLNDALVELPLDSISPIYTTYTITAADLQRVGNVPRKPEDQAKLKKMLYASLLKFLEERFHCDPNFLRQLNPGLNLDQLGEGDTVWVPNVVPFQIENIKATAKLPPVEAYKNRVIKINTREKLLDLYEGDTLLAAFPITPGSSRIPAPVGKWRILGIATMPWFRYDEGVLKHGVRTANFHNIPAGPSNPVGVVWMGLNKPSIGIHGTNNPQTIGRAASAGCIRLANWDAIRLAGMITQGITVIIDEDLIPPPPQNDRMAKVSQTDR